MREILAVPRCRVACYLSYCLLNRIGSSLGSAQPPHYSSKYPLLITSPTAKGEAYLRILEQGILTAPCFGVGEALSWLRTKSHSIPFTNPHLHSSFPNPYSRSTTNHSKPFPHHPKIHATTTKSPPAPAPACVRAVGHLASDFGAGGWFKGGLWGFLS